MTQMTTDSGDLDPEEDASPAAQKSTEAPEGGDGDQTDLAAELEKWKRVARKNEDRVKALTPKAKRLEEIEASNSSDLEKAVRTAREEERSAVTEKMRQRLVKAEIRAAAGTKFNDPADAVAYLSGDIDEFVTEDDDVDVKAVSKAVDRLLASKPYLAPQQKKPPDFDGGPRNTSGTTDMNTLIRSKAAGQ